MVVVTMGATWGLWWSGSREARWNDMEKDV